jgi:uncharacterized protein YuzE
VAKVEVKMAVDPFQIITRALRRTKKRMRVGKIVSIDYDEEADVLYARFAPGKIVDSESLDEEGMVLGALDPRQHIIGITIIHASDFA